MILKEKKKKVDVTLNSMEMRCPVSAAQPRMKVTQALVGAVE